jgi:hypothetical protein
MNIFKKKAAFITILTSAILIASLYGALHNQISYSISPEYFTRFKFQQFDIDTRLPPRIGAAFVGVRATWWMGLLIGLIIALAGAIQKNVKMMIRIAYESYALIFLFTFTAGLFGLLYGIFYLSNLDIYNFSYWYIPENLQDIKAFISVGEMHNFSYLGGLMGLPFGVWWQFYRRRRS